MGMHEVTTYSVAHNIVVSVHYDLLKAGGDGESPDNHLLSPITVEFHPRMSPLLIEPLASLPTGNRLDRPIHLFAAPSGVEPFRISFIPLAEIYIDYSGTPINFPVGYQF